MTPLDELWDLVRAIPRGRVCTYGMLGASLKHRASGFIVGRWMAQCPDGVPWWRVVAKSGSLPIAKVSPVHEFDQRRLLEKEGVRFVDDQIDMKTHYWEPT